MSNDRAIHVEVSGVRKRYGKLDALAGVTLALPAGSRVALIGPNGSGKTTLTRVIMGLVAHDGDVRLDGAPAGAARRDPAARIAYVPQVAPQMAATAGELIRTIAGLRGLVPGVIVDLAQALGLDVAALRARPFRALSGGMKQKLLLALALATRPRLIILDEPTASLDAAARARFAELERDYLAGATVILCSHRLEELRTMVDRVVVLEDGQVRHDGAAAAYVTGHTRSVFEVLVHGDGDAGWLGEQGFQPTAAGWWCRAVEHDDKLRLVAEAIAALGPRLRDLVVRDHDRLAVPEAS